MNAWHAPSHATLTNPASAAPSRAHTQPRLCLSTFHLRTPVAFKPLMAEAFRVQGIDLGIGEGARAVVGRADSVLRDMTSRWHRTGRSSKPWR
jgi:hypothetical protein